MSNVQAKSITTNPARPAKSVGSGLFSLFFARQRTTASKLPGRKTAAKPRPASGLAGTSNGFGRLIRVRFYIRVSSVYLLTLLFGLYLFSPATFFRPPESPVGAAAIQLPPATPPPPQVITGTPVRIIVPRLGINLKVEEGNFDSVKRTWTLSAGNAHFAAPSMPPNDHQGNTLIYGHNHDLVLGLLRNLAPGDEAQVITDNGLTFFYTFTSSRNVKPDDLSAFQYQGPPTLIVQTCTGNWNEMRGLYSFKFQRVGR